MPAANTKKIKLTSATIAAHLVVPDDPRKPTTLYDSELAGFGAYRTSKRPGSYFLHYRFQKRQRKKVIGRTNELNVADARDEAAQIKIAARQGRDLVTSQRIFRRHSVTDAIMGRHIRPQREP